MLSTQIWLSWKSRTVKKLVLGRFILEYIRYSLTAFPINLFKVSFSLQETRQFCIIWITVGGSNFSMHIFFRWRNFGEFLEVFKLVQISLQNNFLYYSIKKKLACGLLFSLNLNSVQSWVGYFDIAFIFLAKLMYFYVPI